MIVPSMNQEEACMELDRDAEAVERWRVRLLNSIRHRVMKCTKFPIAKWLDYISPRKNRYIMHLRIHEKRMRTVLTGLVAIRHEDDGLTAYVRWGERYMIIIPHAFKRYAERVGVEKYGIELVKHYFLHNVHGKDEKNARLVGRSVRWNGEEHQACCVNEGVLLGQVKDKYFLVRTFITYDMATGKQKEVFDARHERVLRISEMFNLNN